jgi:hypothetical protein
VSESLADVARGRKLAAEGGFMKTNAECRSDRIDYLIVTRPVFAESPGLRAFVDCKESQKYRVGLLTVEWIDGHYGGEHLAAKIKAALFEAYGGTASSTFASRRSSGTKEIDATLRAYWP